MTKRIYDPHFREVMVALGIIEESLIHLNRKVEEVMTSQASIDADVQTLSGVLQGVSDVVSDTNTQAGNLVTAVAALAQQLANGQPVSTADLDSLAANAGAVETALQQADAALDSAVASTQALVTPAA